MMKKVVIALMALTTVLLAQSEVTVVLQQGAEVNNQTYSGCIDAHTYSVSPEDNFGNEEEIQTYNCNT